MFLNRLDQGSKKVFLELAYYVAYSDESFLEVQKSLINGYLKEMDISDIDFNPEEFSLDGTLKKVSHNEYQKIILMEIMAVVYTDNVMHHAEKEIIDTMIDTWNLNSNLAVAYGEWSKSLLSLYVQGEALLELN